MILSEFAGAAHSLNGSLLVNPVSIIYKIKDMIRFVVGEISDGQILYGLLTII